MIFPRDINRKIVNSGKIAGENKVQLFITIFILCNFFGFFGIGFINDVFLGGNFWVAISIQIVLNVFGGIFVFRFFIFDESSKIREYKRSEGDSFSKYMFVQKDTVNTCTVMDRLISITEFSNGCAAFTVEMRFGHNNDRLAVQTREMMRSMFAVAHSFGFITRIAVMGEQFSSSNEYREHLSTVNQVKERILRKSLASISKAVINDSNDNSNSNCIYFSVCSSNSYNRVDIENVISNYIKLFENGISAFRSIKFLDNVELMEFFTDFYKVGGIDTSISQAIEVSKDLESEFRNMIELYSLEASDGTVYVSSDINERIFRLKEGSVK